MKYVKKFGNFLNESNGFDVMRTKIENSLNVDLENLGENTKRLKLEEIINQIEYILNDEFISLSSEDDILKDKLTTLIKDIEGDLFDWGAHGGSFDQVKKDILDLIDSNKGILF